MATFKLLPEKNINKTEAATAEAAHNVSLSFIDPLPNNSEIIFDNTAQLCAYTTDGGKTIKYYTGLPVKTINGHESKHCYAFNSLRKFKYDTNGNLHEMRTERHEEIAAEAKACQSTDFNEQAAIVEKLAEYKWTIKKETFRSLDRNGNEIITYLNILTNPQPLTNK